MDSLESPNGLQQLPNNHFRHDSQTDRLSWEYHNVSITRVPGFGFGIAVSGGRDNPHFANGDPSIAVSDVLKGGPAEDRLQVNDRIISVNGVCLENVEYATAVHVLRDSGNTVTLVIKRRVSNLNALASNQSFGAHSNNNAAAQQTIKLYLTKASKKDDFGIVLGCRLFVKEISAKTRDQLASNGYTLQEGDVISRIHNTNTNDSMSLKEAKKIIDGCKERLNLVVLRDVVTNLNNTGMHSPAYSHTAQVSNCSNVDDSFLTGGSSYSTQNLYVQPPTRPAMSTMLDDKNNLTPRGRSRNPLMNVSSLQLELPSLPQNNGFPRNRNGMDEAAVRPPPPKAEDFYSTRRQLYDDDPLQRSKQSAEPRFISFKKEGSVGIRLTGGNEAGIFVTAVQPGSPASLQGLTPGDKILKVNDMDMHEVTREEAVLFLLSLQDRIDLIVQHCKEEYDNVVANQRGDSFHIKSHFHCNNPSKGEMPFKAGDVFRVIDTLHNGVVGSWQVQKVGRGQQEMQRGVIPNKSRAEELATAQFNATKKEMNSSESRTSFFRRKRSNHRRSKSLSKENWDDVVFSDSISKFPAYERVVLRHPGFVRPVVLFGPVADLARERLTKDFPDKYIVPLQQDNEKSNAKSGIVRLSNIRDIMDRGKHALLDITPNAVDKLNYAQFYPIVIFLKTDTKHLIKQLRQGIPKSAHKSSKKLLEQCHKLDRMWSHIFSKTIVLSDIDTWYRKLRDTIDQLQSGAVWMSESKPAESLSDDFLFPMTTSRLSYASSPESDLELSPGPSASLSLGNLPQLVKSSSDPSIATNQDLLERDREQNIGDGIPPTYTSPFEHLPSHPRKVFDSEKLVNKDIDFDSSLLLPGNNEQNQPLYGMVPELPPRIDRASKPNLPSDLLALPNARVLPTGTFGRSSKERNFAALDGNDKDDYHASSLNSSIDKRENSLDRRQRPSKIPGAPNKTNESYESVSSYDSCNTTQISMQRLGPNAPDDLKSVPNANTRSQAHGNDTTMNMPYNESQIMNNLSHDHSKSASMSKNSNIVNSPAKAMHGADLYGKNLGERNMRPTHLPVDQMSPRKSHPHSFETKTDYGKYSRTNSASQADYMKSPLSPQMGKPPNIAFKPVPPPKPKNYRPPVQGNQMNSWENGEPISPRSPNGFFYPSNSHFHSQNMISNPISGNSQHGPPPAHGVNHNLGNQLPYSSINNNYNGNQSFSGHYMHRPPMERHALDLAGSREQRGSAFELYRKPQIGNPGHHHNLSDMDHQASQANLSNAINEHHQYYHMFPPPPPLPPPPIPSSKSQKIKFFKAPFTAIKNVFSSPKKTLQRQNSLIEQKAKKYAVRRQHSMVERRSQFEGQIDPRNLYRCELDDYDHMKRYFGHQEKYDRNSVANTYQNLQSEAFYRCGNYPNSQEQESLYANKSLIEFERRMRSNMSQNRQIIRRHSLADRSGSFQETREHDHRMRQRIQLEEDVYQTKSGAFMVNEPKHLKEPRRDLGGIYQNRREMHLNHLYQTKKEMQERIHQGRIEAEKAIVESPVDDQPSPRNHDGQMGDHKDPVYQTRKELKEKGFRTRTELRDHIYQSRMEAMRSFAEPIYVSRKEIQDIASEARNSITSVEYQIEQDLSGNTANDSELVIESNKTFICNQSDQQKSAASSCNNHDSNTNSDQYNNECLSNVSMQANASTSSIVKGANVPPIAPLRSPFIANSEISIESSNYTSEASLPIGPPNAQSTPYASEVTLGLQQLPLRESTTTRGIFDENGGTLFDNKWNVSIEIPKGAIPTGVKQEIYFTVTDPRLSQNMAGPPLDMENGETMLSPLVMCGPQGLEFLVPVTLNIPHCAGRTTSLGLSLKATDSEKNLKTNWDNIDLPSNAAAHTVSVKVDHF